MGAAESHNSLFDDLSCCHHADAAHQRILVLHRDAEGMSEKRSNPDVLGPAKAQWHAGGDAMRERSQLDKKEVEELFQAKLDPSVLKDALKIVQGGTPAVVLSKAKDYVPLGQLPTNVAPTFPAHLMVFTNYAFAVMVQRSKQKLHRVPLRTIFGPSSSILEQMRLALHIDDHCALEGAKLIIYNSKNDPIQVMMDCMPLRSWSGSFDSFLLTFKCDDQRPTESVLNYWLNKNKFAAGEISFQYELAQSMARKQPQQGMLLQRVAMKNRADLRATEKKRATKDPIHNQASQSMVAVCRGGGMERSINSRTQRKMEMMAATRMSTAPIDTNVQREGADGVLRPFTGTPYDDELSCYAAARGVMASRARRDLELAEMQCLNHKIGPQEFRKVKDAVRL